MYHPPKHDYMNDNLCKQTSPFLVQLRKVITGALKVATWLTKHPMDENVTKTNKVGLIALPYDVNMREMYKYSTGGISSDIGKISIW